MRQKRKKKVNILLNINEFKRPISTIIMIINQYVYEINMTLNKIKIKK